MSNTQTNNGRLVIAEMLRDLPAPVQRYMDYTGVVGKPWIDMARIRYAGRFRMAADKPWRPIRAEQFYTTHPPETPGMVSGDTRSGPRRFQALALFLRQCVDAADQCWL